MASNYNLFNNNDSKKKFPFGEVNKQLPSDNTGEGIFSRMSKDPINTMLTKLTGEIKELKLELKISRLKILSLEGKFTQEEVTNIRKMLMSEDEASRTLANTIIDNA